MKKLLTVLLVSLSTAAQAATIDLTANSMGTIEVYNPYDSHRLFYFYGGGNMTVPAGFSLVDASTWHLATSATYIITVSGGSWPSSMSICNDASNVPSAHPCGHTMLSGFGYVGLDPGPTTLNYFAHMAGNPFGMLVSASLSYDSAWQRSLPYPDEVIATPLPGALPLFVSGLLLLGWRVLRKA